MVYSFMYPNIGRVNHEAPISGEPVNSGNPFTVKSPEWMVMIDDVLKSTVGDFEKFAELFDWDSSSSRLTTGDFGNNLFTSSSLRHSMLELMIPNGSYAPVLEGKMNTGAHIDLVTIVRLGNIKQVKVKLQEIAFTNCRIQHFNQKRDRLVLGIYITSKINTVNEYDQGGNALGQTVSTVDYSTNNAE